MRRTVALGAAVVLLVSGCTKGTSQPAPSLSRGSSGHGTVQIRPEAPPTGAQLHYGTTIGNLPGITYQPAVVVLGGGASSIRSADGSGYVWTIDGSAPGASDLHVGSIMVATTFATGRVLAIKDVAGGDKQVVLGPVALTDVIQDGHFSTGSPVPITGPRYYSMPSDPAATQPFADSDATHDPHTMHDASYHSLFAGKHPPIPKPTQLPSNLPTSVPSSIPTSVPSSLPSEAHTGGSTGVKLPVPKVSAPPTHSGDFTFSPRCCSPDVGMHVTYNSADGRMDADLGFSMATPKLSANIDIDRHGIKDASVNLTGAAALYYKFEAATRNVNGNVPHELFNVPVVVTIPATPFAITLSQTVSLSIQLAGQAVLQSHARYDITGRLGFGYTRGKGFHDYKPSFTTTQSGLDNALSLGVSVNAMALVYHAKLTVGFGVPGVTVGPFVGVDAGLSIAKDGSPPQTSLKEGCVIGAVAVTGYYGVGYVIAKPIARVINLFLSVFNAKPIAPSDGLRSKDFGLWGEGPSQRCPGRK
jgi:hypothetical protein